MKAIIDYRACGICGKNVKYIVKGNCRSCYSNELAKYKRKLNKKEIFLTDIQREVLAGLMLGDGCIQFSHGDTGNNNPRLTMQRNINDKNYMYWLYDFIKNLCNSEPFEYSVFDKRTNKRYYSINLYSKSISCLKSIRYHWYPKGKKIIPRDLKLTPLILLIWFLDDGSFVRRSNTNFNLKLSTHGFNKEDVIFIADLLSKRYSANFRINNDNNNYYITVSRKGALAYINEIKDIFPECMSRKSDKWKGLDLNNKTFKEDGKLFKLIKMEYLLSKSIIENNLNNFYTGDLAKALNLFEIRDGYLIANKKIGYYLKNFISNKILTREKCNPYVKYTLLPDAIEKLKIIYNENKRKIELYNIDLTV